ncbi:MAG: hypothetical protein P1Q69_14900 [Candidatus Thorarchaeota archaeon]|nr:hypothetical protein [Candidatus Thorarchaeota archaeon]
MMYFAVAYVQFTHLECLQPEASVPCDTMLVFVPLFLGILDSAMAFWSANVTKRFWQAAFLVSVLAILVSANSLFPLVWTHDPYTSLQSAMLILGGGVFILSMIDLITLKGIHLQRTFDFERKQPVPSSEIRTYKVHDCAKKSIINAELFTSR